MEIATTFWMEPATQKPTDNPVKALKSITNNKPAQLNTCLPTCQWQEHPNGI